MKLQRAHNKQGSARVHCSFMMNSGIDKCKQTVLVGPFMNSFLKPTVTRFGNMANQWVKSRSTDSFSAHAVWGRIRPNYSE